MIFKRVRKYAKTKLNCGELWSKPIIVPVPIHLSQNPGITFFETVKQNIFYFGIYVYCSTIHAKRKDKNINTDRNNRMQTKRLKCAQICGQCRHLLNYENLKTRNCRNIGAIVFKLKLLNLIRQEYPKF